MGVRNGASKRVAAYVAAHPGCTRADILRACGGDQRWAMPSYAARVGLIFRAGPRSSQRYYPSAELAAAADARIRAEVAARARLSRHRANRQGNLKRRAQRLAAGGKPTNTRRAQQIIVLRPGETLAPDVRITIAPPAPRSRWSV